MKMWCRGRRPEPTGCVHYDLARLPLHPDFLAQFKVETRENPDVSRALAMVVKHMEENR